MDSQSGPVVVGGVGGSGSRLIAEMLQRVGLHLGRDLNSTSDNLWFTLLFRRPGWLERALKSNGSSEVVDALAWFEDAMRGRLQLGVELDRLLGDAVEDLVAQGLDRPFVEERRRRFLQWGMTVPDVGRWGWKEPNSHVYLEFLAEHFADRIRYVHVIRDGIEEVRRGDYRQLQNWGPRFGVVFESGSLPSDPLVLRAFALDYWVAANRRALQLGPELLGERFHLLNLNQLRRDPGPSVTRLLEFVGVDISTEDVSSLCRLAEPPVNTPAPADYFGLTEVQRDGFAMLGFEIPGVA
jgi:hypothetical protein